MESIRGFPDSPPPPGRLSNQTKQIRQWHRRRVSQPCKTNLSPLAHVSPKKNLRHVSECLGVCWLLFEPPRFHARNAKREHPLKSLRRVSSASRSQRRPRRSSWDKSEKPIQLGAWEVVTWKKTYIYIHTHTHKLRLRENEARQLSFSPDVAKEPRSSSAFSHGCRC